MSSHPPGRLGGGAQSGAGSGAEGAGLGTGLGGLSPQGEARGFGGTALPTPGGRAAGSGTPAARVCGRLGVQEQRRVAGGRLAGVGVSALANVQLPSTDGLAREEQGLCPWAPCEGPVCRQYTD